MTAQKTSAEKGKKKYDKAKPPKAAERNYGFSLDVEKVIDIMRENGISKKELAILIGVDDHTLSNYLKNPYTLKLNIIADILYVLDVRVPEKYIVLVDRKEQAN